MLSTSSRSGHGKDSGLEPASGGPVRQRSKAPSGKPRLPVLLWIYGILTVLPLLAGWLYSLAYSTGLAGHAALRAVGQPAVDSGVLAGKPLLDLDAWQRLLSPAAQGGEAWQTLTYTFGLSAVSIGFIIFIALPLSYAFVFGRRSSSLQGWLFLPLTMPPVVAAFAFLALLSPSGVLSRGAYALGLSTGIDDFPRLVNDALSTGIIATQVFLLTPFFTLVFINQARQENMPALRLAADALGSKRAQFARRIYAPLLLRRSLPLLLLYAVYLFGTYEIPLLLGRSSPRAVTVYITEQLQRFDLSNIPLGHAMAVLYTASVAVLLFFVLSRRAGQIREP